MSSDFDFNAEPPPSPFSPPPPAPALPRVLPVSSPRPPRRRLPAWVVLLASFCALLSFLAIVVGGWLLWTNAANARRNAALAEEREADRQEMTAAFLEPTPPTPEEAREFGTLFDRLGASLAAENEFEVTTAFDADRLTHELEVAGMVENFGPQVSRRKLLAEVRAGIAGEIGRALLKNAALRWQSTAVRKVRWSEDRSEAVVIAVHRADWGAAVGTVVLKVRWWLIARNGVWKIYDVEDLDGGYRMTRVMASMISPQHARNPAKITQSAAKLQEAIQAIKNLDLDAGDRALSSIPDDGLAKPVMAVVEILKACILLGRQKPAEALEKCAIVERLNADMPMLHSIRASAYLQLERYEECIASARKYLALLGSDPDASLSEGAALEALGRADEALAAYRTVLEETPDELGALGGLRRVLPPADKAELSTRLAKTRDPKASYESLAPDARIEGDRPGITALLDGLRKRLPDDALVLAEDVRSHVEANRFDPARVVLAKGLKLTNVDERRSVRNAYLYAMSGKEKTLEAYAAVPDGDAEEAFRLLTTSLMEFEDDDFQIVASGKGADRLRALIAAHRKRRPGDAWLRYYEAMLLLGAKDFTGAEALFAAGAKKLGKSVEDHERQLFRSKRVECFYRLGKGLEAYEMIGPAEDTFRQLAWSYLGDKKLDDLKNLIDAHEKRHPNETLAMYWRGQWHFARAEYPAAADAYRRFRNKAKEDDPLHYGANDQFIRSLLRTGRVMEAQGILRSLGDNVPGLPLRAAVAAARKDLPEVDRLMSERDPKWGHEFFYSDEDFDRETAGPKFDGIRAKYPPPKKEPAKPDT